MSMALVKADPLGQLENLLSFSYLTLLFFLFTELLISFGGFILAILKCKYY